MITDVLWAAVIITGSAGFGIVVDEIIIAIRHRNEHYEPNDPYRGSRQ